MYFSFRRFCHLKNFLTKKIINDSLVLESEEFDGKYYRVSI